MTITILAIYSPVTIQMKIFSYPAGIDKETREIFYGLYLCSFMRFVKNQYLFATPCTTPSQDANNWQLISVCYARGQVRLRDQTIRKTYTNIILSNETN